MLLSSRKQSRDGRDSIANPEYVAYEEKPQHWCVIDDGDEAKGVQQPFWAG